MSYTALYRKWRPQVFEEVVGQESITATLRNQISSKTIGHAYLFSGTRGTGKTSTAKIFSRVINCLAPVDSNPCNVCEICKGILDESLMDVVEIDAASNNGVDDIRELRENVKYPPSKAAYKVFIIDEVHMLSTGAFNALLKTLEEPPSYVVFILATTEPHKLPATILSRCQKFDFKRVGASDLSFRLKYIIGAQDYTITDDALETIIRKSDGAVRDALSMLDQCFSYGEQHIDEHVVSEALGLVNREVISELVDLIADQSIIGVFDVIDKMIANGKNLNQFVKDFIEYYRDLLMVSAAGKDPKLVKTGTALDLLDAQASKLKISGIWSGLQSLIELDNSMKWSANTRILLEMNLVKMTQGEGPTQNSGTSKEIGVELQPLLTRIDLLEKTLQAVVSGKGNVSYNSSPQANKTEVKSQQTPSLLQKASESGQMSKSAMSAAAGREEGPINESIMSVESNEPVDGKIIFDKWHEILQYLKKRKVSLYAFLVEGTLISVNGKSVNVGFKEGFGFHLNAISQDSNRQEVEKSIQAITGFSVRLNFDYLEAFAGTNNQNDGAEENEDALKKFFGNQADRLEVIE